MSSASENALATSNVFSFIGFSLWRHLIPNVPPRTIARCKHGTHNAPVGAVRIRTVVEPRRGRKKAWIGCGALNSQTGRPPKTWFVRL